MTVKENICQTLRLVGRDDAADEIGGTAALSPEVSRLKNAFLTYFNSVLDELARGYFPPSAVDEILLIDGRKSLSSFVKRVVRIKKVIVENREVEWYVSSGYLYVNAENATVYYEYAPKPLKESDEFYYPEFSISERLVQYGVAAEHYLVTGCAEESRLWEQRYRDEIETLIARCPIKPRVAPRRWI